jgi:hypothetical protein
MINNQLNWILGISGSTIFVCQDRNKVFSGAFDELNYWEEEGALSSSYFTTIN